jgi:7-cyano-7-deazaguanine reductase
MSDSDSSPLGQSVSYDAAYDPTLLFAISRLSGRERLGLNGPLPFSGSDIWNAYEMSWLNARGKPVVAWAEFRIPANSPNIVESKSFKLYLNSLNQRCFDDVDAVTQTLQRDLSACAGAEIEVLLRLPDLWPQFPFSEPVGDCLDVLDVAIEHYTPQPELLQVHSAQIVSRKLYSRLLRSRCPVTGQPDWGVVSVNYTGPEIDRAGLLAYVISFRQHQGFHEQCVERMFCDIQQRCAPQSLTVFARYLRRGGLDINPYRSTDQFRPQNNRLFQQ